ncbi:hypothetical protein HA402_001624 [Bradysia odoriphaga]|nr:hypothetical protein HA402_001624 [Bradysia odoriphaga]
MKMDVKIVVAFFVIGLITKGHAQLCYVCDNCADGNNLPEEFLISCSAEETTTTVVEPSSTTVQTVEPPVETIPPTNPPEETSTSQETSPTEESTPPPTDPVPESSTEPPPEEPTTQETVPSTQSPGEQSSTLSTVPVPESPITTTSLIPVTENTNAPPTEGTTATMPSAPPSTTERPIVTPPSETSRLQQQTPVKQAVYNCYVLVNATNHVNRGCVAASRYPNDMCRIANGLVLPLECRVCDTDKCNSSSRTVLSVFLLVFSVGTILGL